MSLTVKQFPCEIHDGWTVGAGYAGVTRNGKTKIASRVVWEEVHGPIPDGYEIHHVCENKLCVNLDHLRLIERRQHRLLHQQHVVAGMKGAAVQVAKTQCANGHEFTPENTYIDSHGWRSCRRCRAEAARRFRRKGVIE
jgi:hypothetical protein